MKKIFLLIFFVSANLCLNIQAINKKKLAYKTGSVCSGVTSAIAAVLSSTTFTLCVVASRNPNSCSEKILLPGYTLSLAFASLSAYLMYKNCKT